MKKLFLNVIPIVMTCSTVLAAPSDNKLNNFGSLYISQGASVLVQGTVMNDTNANLVNNGNLLISGNLINNQNMTDPYGGTYKLNGTEVQIVSGNVLYVKHLLVDNVNGITLSTPVKVDSMLSLVNGIIDASGSNTITFAAGANHNGASDANHINGIVVKEGLGLFSFPIGDGTKYQKVDINPTINTNGISAKYNVGDAGTGTFANTGTEATALVARNTLEYWDINPLGTATATISIYWDQYNDSNITDISHLKVAHLTSGSWLNEGGTGTGSIAYGSVTSNPISEWSPFTLGSINSGSPLSISWINTNATNINNQAFIDWKVIEHSVKHYTVERYEATSWKEVSVHTSKGDGINSYTYTDVNAFEKENIAQYRIRQTDINGNSTYSKILIVNANNGLSGNAQCKVYPNPFSTTTNIKVDIAQEALLTDISGHLVMKVNLDKGENQLNFSNLPQGTFLLKLSNGNTLKLVKN